MLALLGVCICSSYKSFMGLNPEATKWRLKEAAKKIGILWLSDYIWASVQTNMMLNLCFEDTESKVYFHMTDKAWRFVRSWGRRSKRVKGTE
jgi:hypothetical protein